MAELQPVPVYAPITPDAGLLSREWVLYLTALQAKIKELEARIAALEAE